MSELNPYEAPIINTGRKRAAHATASQGIWADGKLLVVSKSATLPPVCVLTNKPSKREVKRKFYWHHPTLYFSVLAGLLIYFVLVLVLRKTHKLALPLSGTALKKRRNGLLLSFFLDF